MTNSTPDGPNAERRKPPDLLSVEQRSALLRGARMRLTQLHEECESLSKRGEHFQLTECLREIHLLEQGIAWLWRGTGL